MGCLDDIVVLELLEGALAPEAIARADAHLDGCSTCRGVVASAARLRRRDAGAATSLAPGDRIGRFVIGPEIGTGAMGVVMAAFDPDLDRRIAIKVLRPELGGNEARARMVREAQAMARLSHPNVVAVYDVGEIGQAFYLAMELVEGSTLRGFLAAAPRTTEVILDAFVQAGRGLEAAHQAGIVHRDFKPDNVLVARDGRVRVTDFGLARAPVSQGEAPEPSDPIEVTLTRTGALLGTPAYMAPEQLAGKAADARSDQVAFAVALFEALYGHRPFGGGAVRDLVAAMQRGELRAPDKRRLSREAHAALLRALAIDPARRHSSVGALVRAIAPRPALRARGIVIAVALCAGAALGAAALALGGGGDEGACTGGPAALARVWGEERAAAVRSSFRAKAPSFGDAAANEVIGRLDGWGRRWVDAHGEACRSTNVRREQSEALLDARMACLDRELAEVEALVTNLDGVDAEGAARAADLLAASLPDVDRCADRDGLAAMPPPTDPEARKHAAASAEAAGEARALLTVGNLAAAAEKATLAVAEGKASTHPATTGSALLVAAEIERAAGATSAQRTAEEALFALEEARDDRGAARAWILLLTIEGARARYERAAEIAGFANAAIARAGRPAALSADLAEAMGAVLLGRGALPEAERELDRALALARELGEEDDARGARILTNLGNAVRSRGEPAAALEHHRRAMAIDEKRLGAEHPAIGRHLHNVAGVLKLLGRRDEALSAYRRAIEVKKKALGSEHPDVALTLNSIGIVLAERGDIAGAKAAYEEAIRIFSRARHEQEATVRQNLAAIETPAAKPAAAPISPRRAKTPASPQPAPSGKATGTYMPAPAWP